MKKKLKKIVPATYDKIEKDFDKIVDLKVRTSPRTMLDFEVQLVDHCNLNCKGCSHFSPLASKNFLDVNKYEKDIKRLSLLANGEASFIRLMGGEPLMHPDIVKFLNVTRKYFKNTVIDVDTNGILAPSMNDNFYKAMHNNNINLVITKYPIKIDCKKIKEKCKKFNVNFRFFDEENSKKARKFNLLALDLEGRGSSEKNFCHCYLANTCHNLRNGKMYTCPTIPYIDIFNKKFKQNLSVSRKDYIDIYKAKSLEEILEFLSHPVPFCRYCDVKGRKYCLKWDKSKKDIKEWVD